MTMTLLYVTHPSKKVAVSITETLLKKHLIACANLFPVESRYRWKGKIQEGREWVTVLKTRADLKKGVEQEIKKHHPYGVPCIIQLPAKANSLFEKWIQKETEGRNGEYNCSN